MEANIYIETDGNDVKKRKRICGYVLESIIGGEAHTKEEFFEVEDTFHGAVIAAVVKALQRFKKTCTITIYAQDAWVLNMIDSQLEKWADNNFLNGHGKPIEHQKQWIHVWLKTREYEICTKRGKHAYSEWMKERMQHENAIGTSD